MERSFIATKESEYVKDFDKYSELNNQQKEFVNKFFTEKGIEANCYRIGGNGSVNKPFNDYDKNNIGFSIIPTDNDLIKFSKMLCKPDNNDLCAFKKSSTISKEFAQKCVDENIVINLHSPRISNYFISLGWHGLSRSQFPVGDDLYIKVSSEHLEADDVVEGFTEIKLSEYYIAKEKFESKNNIKEMI